MIGMFPKRNEPVFPVEGDRAFVDGVHEGGIAGDACAGLDYSPQGIDEQYFSKALSLMITGDRETADQGGRYLRIARQSPALGIGQLAEVDRVAAERIKPCYLMAFGPHRHEHAGDVFGMVLPGLFAKVSIERLVTT